MKMKYKGIIFGMLLLLITMPAGMNNEIYAAEATYNAMESGETEVNGNADVGVDINLQNEAASSQSASSGAGASGSTSKPSTNDVGKGLNGKVSPNAKTGDIFSGRNIVIFLAAVGVLLAGCLVKVKK